MKKMFWRVFVSFGLVLLIFSVLIGLMFTRFNKTNIDGAYKQQLGDLASGVASYVRQAAMNEEEESYTDYLMALNELCEAQEIDVWIMSNSLAREPLSEDYTTSTVEDLFRAYPQEETRTILSSACKGNVKSYSAYDETLKSTMLRLMAPIRNDAGEVMGVVYVYGPMEMQNNTVIQYQKYMSVCVMIGLLLALLLAVVFSQMLVRPIVKIKESALILAAGNYAHKTGVKRRDELGSLAESMDVLSDRLVEAEEYREASEQNRRDFFSNVSHELRTPITVIKGYVDSMVEGLVTDEKKRTEYMNRIQSECGGMERLVSDLLILSRMQNPDYELNMETLNIIAVAQDAMRGIRILMKEKDMTGQVDYQDACSLVEGDYDRIRQLFTILLQNAVKYGDPGTRIQVDIDREEGLIKARIQDFGSVIPEEEWDNVFEKFYRASNHGEHEGSGLGLVVAKNICQRHNAKIYVTSSKENGTCFHLIFPESSQNIS